jgi:pimeloyl-ACP methyl ester carboxylesterase
MAALRAADLRGVARLTIDATAGLTDLVEAVHQRIARMPMVPMVPTVPGLPRLSPPTLDGRTRGVTGLVYKTVRGVTRLVGGSVDALLAALTHALGEQAQVSAEQVQHSAERWAMIAALNGVIGDHLDATRNPLAIAMALRRNGRALPLHEAAATHDGRVLLLLHGLCMSDMQWSRHGHDHGALLARELDMTPLYLHYNTGLHIAANGRALAAQLEALLDSSGPQALRRLVLVGYSMGGLVARSAMHHAARAGQRWPALVSDMVFIGTPHHGAPLERAGHWLDAVLGATPYAAPLARLGRVRSAGINDLRHGSVLDATASTASAGGRRAHVPLPAGVRCTAIAASLGAQAGDVKDRLLGDGLVPLDSALGRHRDGARCLAFAPERRCTLLGLHHLDLLSSAEVTARMLGYLVDSTTAMRR